MNETNIHKAIYTLTHSEQLGASLLEINEKVYNLIVNLQLSLEQDIDDSGKKQFHTVRFIDFENYQNNDYHVVSQMKIKGVNENCMPDLIIYINGIPVVVIECKSPFKEQESNVKLGKKDAYEQLRRYMNLRGAEQDEGIDKLFYTNFITGIFNKYHAYVGTISSKYNHYLEWKDPYPFKNKRAEYEIAYKQYATTLEALMPSHVNKKDINDLKWMAYVRAGAKARYEPENEIDISDCGEKAREIISKHLQAKGVIQWIQPISLFDKDFQDKMDTFKSDEAAASSMEHAIRHVISVKMEDNPVHYTSLLEKLQQLLDETKLSWEERKAKLKEFIAREIELGEEDEANRLGFCSNKEYAIYL